ncbi:hypothetical protein Tco_0994418 [Tanacetum coccineum]
MVVERGSGWERKVEDEVGEEGRLEAELVVGWVECGWGRGERMGGSELRRESFEKLGVGGLDEEEGGSRMWEVRGRWCETRERRRVEKLWREEKRLYWRGEVEKEDGRIGRKWSVCVVGHWCGRDEAVGRVGRRGKGERIEVRWRDERRTGENVGMATEFGNDFHNLVPLSKHPYKGSEYENEEIAQSMKEEKKRKQRENIAEDLFNKTKVHLLA